MLTVYGHIESGNCYKVALLCALTQQAYRWQPIDLLAGDTQTAKFLAKNPNGKTPVVVFEDGRTLWESNAILQYLAQGTPLWPNDTWQQAKALQWMFFEQYSHEPYIAVARSIKRFFGLPEARRAEYDAKQVGGHKALAVMEQQLTHTPYLVGDTLTIADIALYAYTHVAHEGGFDLSTYPSIGAWLQRIEQSAHYANMQTILAEH
jgi:glutathione S-transferase